MEGSAFDELLFFRALGKAPVRALLIGRQAMISLGMPVVTRDYDLWVHIDDMERLNEAVEPFELWPNRTPEEARRHGRYVLENDEHIDVLVARSVPTVDGVPVAFDDVWSRRQGIQLDERTCIHVPSLDDLVLTKRFGGRPRDAEDIRMIEAFRSRQGG